MPNFVKLPTLSPASTEPIKSEATWVASDKQTNAALGAVAAGIASVQRHLSHFTISFAAVTTAAVELQVMDGTNQIWGIQVGVGVLVITENFETRPIHGSPGQALTIQTSGSAGAMVAEVYACGYNTKQNEDQTLTET